MSQSHFFAHLSRLKLINRWPLMRNVRTENVSEHSLQVAMVAHALAAIKNRKFGGQVNPERIALLAMYHDASEVLTGDLPTPVKYFNSQIAQEYKAIEKIAQQKRKRKRKDQPQRAPFGQIAQTPLPFPFPFYCKGRRMARKKENFCFVKIMLKI